MAITSGIATPSFWREGGAAIDQNLALIRMVALGQSLDPEHPKRLPMLLIARAKYTSKEGYEIILPVCDTGSIVVIELDNRAVVHSLALVPACKVPDRLGVTAVPRGTASLQAAASRAAVCTAGYRHWRTEPS
jgi:hypothetical protein